MMEAWQLKQMQALPLEVKILKTQQRIREWYEAWDGQVYVSFSGGKDSTVLLKLVRELYPDVEAVFIDTGLEYPEIRTHVKSIGNVVWLKPKMVFTDVIKKYGYPVIGKDVATMLMYAKKGRQWAIDRLNGVNSDGSKSMFKQRFMKYKYLIDSPFLISSSCCDVMKKGPAKKYERESGNKAFIGTMAGESAMRRTSYLITGCNAFGAKRPKSTPMGFWGEQDVLEYLLKFNTPYAKVYGDIVQTSKGLSTTGESRTGCMWCMFREHLEKGETKFQRMSKTHPKQYDYCINKLGLGEVLDYIGVDYRVNDLFEGGTV